jgi:hypothetical protein
MKQKLNRKKLFNFDKAVSPQFMTYDYSAKEYIQDTNGIQYYLQRSGSSQEPKLSLEDSIITINTKHPFYKEQSYFYDKFRENPIVAVANYLLYLAMRDVLIKYKSQLIDLGLLVEESDGIVFYMPLIERLTKIKRDIKKEKYSLDESEVIAAIDTCANEIRKK